MNIKKLTAGALAIILSLTALVSCARKEEEKANLKVAVLESAYGSDMCL